MMHSIPLYIYEPQYIYLIKVSICFNVISSFPPIMLWLATLWNLFVSSCTQWPLNATMTPTPLMPDSRRSRAGLEGKVPSRVASSANNTINKVSWGGGVIPCSSPVCVCVWRESTAPRRSGQSKEGAGQAKRMEEVVLEVGKSNHGVGSCCTEVGTPTVPPAEVSTPSSLSVTLMHSTYGMPPGSVETSPHKEGHSGSGDRRHPLEKEVDSLPHPHLILPQHHPQHGEEHGGERGCPVPPATASPHAPEHHLTCCPMAFSSTSTNLWQFCRTWRREGEMNRGVHTSNTGKESFKMS